MTNVLALSYNCSSARLAYLLTFSNSVSVEFLVCRALAVPSFYIIIILSAVLIVFGPFSVLFIQLFLIFIHKSAFSFNYMRVHCLVNLCILCFCVSVQWRMALHTAAE